MLRTVRCLVFLIATFVAWWIGQPQAHLVICCHHQEQMGVVSHFRVRTCAKHTSLSEHQAKHSSTSHVRDPNLTKAVPAVTPFPLISLCLFLQRGAELQCSIHLQSNKQYPVAGTAIKGQFVTLWVGGKFEWGGGANRDLLRM